MKKVAIITVVGVALLVLATGAWVADGVRAVRGASRRRRIEHAAEHLSLREARRRSSHGTDYAPEGPERFAVA
jgi:hypothetical protein